MIKRFMAWLKSIYLKPALQASKQETAMSNFTLVLSTTTNGAVADGATANSLQVKVTDSTGAAAAAQTVTLTSDAAVTITPASAVTDATGLATVSLTSSTAGTYAVTGTLADGTTATGTVLFAAVAVAAAASSTPDTTGDNTGSNAAASTQAATEISTVSGTANVSGDTGSQGTDLDVSFSPLAALKADFEAVVAFIEHGIKLFGKEAEADLVALKNKFHI